VIGLSNHDRDIPKRLNFTEIRFDRHAVGITTHPELSERVELNMLDYRFPSHDLLCNSL
jgi:hypothetical protein